MRTAFEELEAQKRILKEAYEHHVESAKTDVKNSVVHSWYAEGIRYAYEQIFGGIDK